MRVPAFFLALLILLLPGCGRFPGETPGPPAPETLESQIRSLLEMPACEQFYREVIYLGEQAQFLSFTTRDKRLLFSVEMHVVAGLDLSIPPRVKTRGWEEAVITLPPPKILLIDADESTLYQYFLKERGDSFTRLEYYDAILQAKDRIRSEAVRRGILETARINSETLLRNLFQMAGFRTVTFRETRNLMGGAGE